MGRPKGSKNKSKEEKQVTPQPTVAVTHANKIYISENFGKISLAEMAKNTGLTEVEVERVATSRELDVPLTSSEANNSLRRFQTKSDGGRKGSVAMTGSQSHLDDLEYSKNLPNADEVNANIPGLEKIIIRKV